METQYTMKSGTFVALRAVALTELRMAWRRGSLRSIVIMMLVLPYLFYLVTPGIEDVKALDLSLYPETARLVYTSAAISMHTFIYIVILWILPLLLSEVIPLDRQHKMDEVLRTLPVPRGHYLGAKMLAYWAIVFVSLTLVTVLIGALAWFQLGSFDMGTLLLFWAVALVLPGLFSSQMGLMLAVGRDTRRGAILLGVVASVLSIGAFMLLPSNAYLLNSLLITAIASMAPGDVASNLSLPNPTEFGYWLRIAITITCMAGIWAMTARRLRAEFKA